jgi:hypothetical protein
MGFPERDFSVFLPIRVPHPCVALFVCLWQVVAMNASCHLPPSMCPIPCKLGTRCDLFRFPTKAFSLLAREDSRGYGAAGREEAPVSHNVPHLCSSLIRSSIRREKPSVPWSLELKVAHMTYFRFQIPCVSSVASSAMAHCCAWGRFLVAAVS